MRLCISLEIDWNYFKEELLKLENFNINVQYITFLLLQIVRSCITVSPIVYRISSTALDFFLRTIRYEQFCFQIEELSSIIFDDNFKSLIFQL